MQQRHVRRLQGEPWVHRRGGSSQVQGHPWRCRSGGRLVGQGLSISEEGSRGNGRGLGKRWVWGTKLPNRRGCGGQLRGEHSWAEMLLRLQGCSARSLATGRLHL